MLIRRVKHALVALAARLIRRRRLEPQRLRSLTPRCILIVRQHNQMGDMVCATPCLRAIREMYPAANIFLITAPVNAEVVRHNPHLDGILVFAQRLWRRPVDLWRFWRAVRACGAELAFILNSVSFSVTSAALGLVCGARYVVGCTSEPYGWELSRHAYSLEMPSRPELSGNAIEHNLAPLQAVGITTDSLHTEVLPAAAEVAAAEQLTNDLRGTGAPWVLHPGAGKLQNLWPARRFAAIACRAAAAGHPVLVLQGPADGEVLVRFREALTRERLDDLPGSITVAPLQPVGVCAAVLQRADRFLCNDTGLMHVAGAMGVPTIALFGPTDPARWKPVNAAVVALRGERTRDDPRGPEYGWLESLTEDEVWRQLSGAARAPNDKGIEIG